MKTVFASRLLKLALWADAAVSGAVAVLQLAAADAMSDWLHLPRVLFVETGAFLVAYTLLLVVLARSRAVPSALIGLVVLGNVGWAVGCVALLVSGALSPAPIGVGYLLAQALIVLLFAVLQVRGLAHSAPARAPREKAGAQ